MKPRTLPGSRLADGQTDPTASSGGGSASGRTGPIRPAVRRWRRRPETVRPVRHDGGPALPVRATKPRAGL